MGAGVGGMDLMSGKEEMVSGRVVADGEVRKGTVTYLVDGGVLPLQVWRHPPPSYRGLRGEEHGGGG